MLLGYCLSCIFLIWKNAYEGKLIKDVPSKQFRVTRRWLVILISNVLIMTLNFLYLTIVFADTSASETITNTNNLYYATGFLFCLMALGLLFFPQVLYGMPRYKENEELLENEENDGQKNINYSKENSQKNNTVTDNEPFLELANRIEEYVAREKPYTNPDFSIEDLAKGLLVPLNHVSYCLSNVMNTKFTSYRMQLRIEFAKELLKSGKNQEFTIEGIAKQAGFSTRSNFYSAFKAETGYTPTEYMKKSFL